jgi:hypothetical protein
VPTSIEVLVEAGFQVKVHSARRESLALAAFVVGLDRLGRAELHASLLTSGVIRATVGTSEPLLDFAGHGEESALDVRAVLG